MVKYRVYLLNRRKATFSNRDAALTYVAAQVQSSSFSYGDFEILDDSDGDD